ncbi:MAG: hypothetical protein P4M11_03065 [Candidatus Pacebacteria bacterium]|nr:hypothetical protein [Candidatus Paceibacterota bacterium]
MGTGPAAGDQPVPSPLTSKDNGSSVLSKPKAKSKPRRKKQNKSPAAAKHDDRESKEEAVQRVPVEREESKSEGHQPDPEPEPILKLHSLEGKEEVPKAAQNPQEKKKADEGVGTEDLPQWDLGDTAEVDSVVEERATAKLRKTAEARRNATTRHCQCEIF